MDITNITKGEILTISDQNEYKPGQFNQTFTLRTDEAYPTILEFTMFNKAIDGFGSKLAVGLKFGIKFNVKGREYNGRYYFTLQPWSVELLDKPSFEEGTEEVMPEPEADALPDEENPF